MAWEVLPDFERELDVVGMGWSSAHALAGWKKKDGVGGLTSELLAMAEVQSHSFAPALPELGVWPWSRCML